MQRTDPSQHQVENDQPIEAEYADPGNAVWTDTIAEIFKKSLPFTNDVLRQLLTFNTALLSGSIFFLNEKNCESGLRFVAMGLFLVGLVFSFVGILPYRDTVCLTDVDDAKRNITSALNWKNSCIWGATIFILLGLGMAFLSVVLAPHSQQ